MLMLALQSGSLAFLLATTGVIASPVRTRSPYVVKDVHNVPNRWWNSGPAPAHRIINLHIGLKQGQFDELERNLYEGTLYAPQLRATDHKGHHQNPLLIIIPSQSPYPLTPDMASISLPMR